MQFRIILSQIVILVMGVSFTFAQVDVIGDQNFQIIQNNNQISLPFFSNQSFGGLFQVKVKLMTSGRISRCTTRV